MHLDSWGECLAPPSQPAANHSCRARPKNMLSIGLVLSLLLIVLAACGGSGGLTSQNRQVVHLPHPLWDANPQPTDQKFLQQFEQLHPQTQVTIGPNPRT